MVQELQTDRLHPQSLLMLGHMCNLRPLFQSDLPFASAMSAFLAVFLPIQMQCDEARSTTTDNTQMPMVQFNIFDAFKISNQDGKPLKDANPPLSIDYMYSLHDLTGEVNLATRRGYTCDNWCADRSQVTNPHQLGVIVKRFTDLGYAYKQRAKKLVSQGSPGQQMSGVSWGLAAKPAWAYFSTIAKQVRVDESSGSDDPSHKGGHGNESSSSSESERDASSSEEASVAGADKKRRKAAALREESESEAGVASLAETQELQSEEEPARSVCVCVFPIRHMTVIFNLISVGLKSFCACYLMQIRLFCCFSRRFIMSNLVRCGVCARWFACFFAFQSFFGNSWQSLVDVKRCAKDQHSFHGTM